MLVAAFPSDRTPVVAATACLVPFLLDPAAALGRPPPLAHEGAVCVTSRGGLAWCVGCGVHGAVSVGVAVGRHSPSCLVVRPFVVALPTVWSSVCAGAASCAYSCSAHVRPCAQGRCGRCLPGSGVMSEKFLFFFSAESVTGPTLILQRTSTYICMGYCIYGILFCYVVLWQSHSVASLHTRSAVPDDAVWQKQMLEGLKTNVLSTW